jgi:catechol 2,3-dioxygenase-like lactoylglutathione lyase family enzyme
MGLEVVTLPVSDVDRAKRFYQSLGWRLDADIVAARSDLISRGVDVGEVDNTRPPSSDRKPTARTSPTPRSRTRMATAGCSKRSRPGCVAGNGRTDMDIASLADLLRETAEHHGSFEAVAPPHDWWDWYAAYMQARERGSTPEEASAAARRYMAEAKHAVVPA